MSFLFTIYFLLFTFLAWKNFRWAIGILILSLPTYLIRVDIGPLPSTLLELSFGAVFLVWLIRYAREDWPKIIALIKNNRWFFVFVGLFLLASIVSIFRAGIVSQNHVLAMTRAFGHWRAYFLEPMLLFLVLSVRARSDEIIKFLTLSTISISIVAVVQKFTGHWYPPQLWDDVLNGRVTSFFTSPNAVGLYLAPVVFLAAILIAKKLQVTCYKLHDKLLFCYIVILLLSLSAILFSYSQGAWIAVGAGVIVLAFLFGYKKTAIIIILLGLATAFYIPDIRTAVLFQDKASQNRILLWSTSGQYLTRSPGNFVFGTGIRKFYSEIQKPLFVQKKMEQLLYPHNLFLNFWTETGLLGVLSFVGLLAYLFWYSWQLKYRDKILSVGLIAVLMAFLVQGLVDVPYFKNDLAFLFWLLVSTTVISTPTQSGEKTLSVGDLDRDLSLRSR